ncbi:MAG: DUF1624 domain-containing protein [Candidatus Hydrogenedentes bacterium]|nr:DUF1624 domain-containing protein [Candidatus Hydrogenedentota bacterium]
MSQDVQEGADPAFIDQLCSECGKPLRIPVQFEGQFGTCRHCGATILAEHASRLRKPVIIAPQSTRLLSLDVLRGFDMFWIIGTDSLCEALEKASGGEAAPGLIKGVAHQLKHVPWKGFVFYDLIFPLFVFIVGMSAVFSLNKIIERDGKVGAFKRIARRAASLFLIGVLYDVIDCLYSGGMKEVLDENLICGVLQRIALCYLITGTLLCLLELRGLIVTFVVLLAGYWAALSFIPAPGESQVVFERGRNIIHYIDQTYLPYHGTDPESLMTTFGAICSCLLGAFTAFLIRESGWDEREQAKWFLIGGLAMVILGYLWGIQIPIIKRLWTPSYIFVAGGYSLMLLGLFIWVVDVQEWQSWTAPFLWIGANSMAVYLFGNFVRPAEWLTVLSGGHSVGAGAEAFLALLRVGLAVGFVYFLHKKEIYIRV